jgi:hypothetical protein
MREKEEDFGGQAPVEYDVAFDNGTPCHEEDVGGNSANE